MRNACISTNATLFVDERTTPSDIEILKKAFWRSKRSATYSVGILSRDLRRRAVKTVTRAAIIDRYEERNCGHVLGDEAWPLFRLMRRANLYVTDDDKLDIFVDRKLPSKCDEALEPLTNFAHVYSLRISHHRTHCYDTLHFGISGLSYVDNDVEYLRSSAFPREMREFRALFYKHSGVLQPRSKPSKVVIMLKRNGSHLVNIENVEQVKSSAMRTFRGLDVVIACWEDYTLVEQVQLMSDTKVLIGLPGSDIMNSIFMPDGSFVVLYCRYVAGVKEASNEVRLWLQYLRYVNVHQFCEEPFDVQLSGSGDVIVNASHFVGIANVVEGLGND